MDDEKSILLVGEPMGLFIAKSEGAFEDVDEYSVATCGAEFNVAIGLTRLGHRASYLTKLGPDPFGKRIVKQMKREGIATDDILYDDALRTGFMLKGSTSVGDPAIYYFRAGSAASTLSPADIDLRYVAVRKSKVFLGSKNHGLFIYDLKKNTFRRVSDITICDPLIDVEKAKENYGITVVHSLPSNKSYDVIAVTTAHDIFSRDAFLHIEHKPIMHLCEKATE